MSPYIKEITLCLWRVNWLGAHPCGRSSRWKEQLKPASKEMGLDSRLTADGATKPNTTLQPQLTQTWQFLFNTAADTNLSSAKQTLNEADPDLSFYPNERLQWRFTSYVILGFRRYEILWNLQTDSINEKEKPSYMRARAHTHTHTHTRAAHTYVPRTCKHTSHLPHMPTYLHSILSVQPRSDSLHHTESKV